MPPFEIFVRFGVKGGKVISIKERGLTKVAAVCRPKFVPSLSKFKGKHFIRRRAKNQLTQQKETLRTGFLLPSSLRKLEVSRKAGNPVFLGENISVHFCIPILGTEESERDRKLKL